MKSKLMVISALCLPIFAHALDGDAKLACEAILCLSSGEKPSECRPSLSKYFSLHASRHKSIFNVRKSFLSLCPKSDGNYSDAKKEIYENIGEDLNQNQQDLATLENTIASLPNDCTPESLNKNIQSRCVAYESGHCDGGRVYRVNPFLPKACSDLINHKFTNLALPTYTGDYKYSEYIQFLNDENKNSPWK